MREATTGNLGTFIRPKRSAARPKRNLERRAARRVILPGYPVEPRPFTRVEIEAYLSGDSVTCMLCGKEYKKIALHLRTIHSVEADEYRGMYGLPWCKGLSGEDTRAKHSAIAKHRLEQHDHLAEYRHLRRTSGKPPRPKQPYHQQEMTARILASAGRDVQYPPDTFDEFLRRMATGRTRTEVGEDEDMPNASWINARIKGNPELEMRYAQTIEALPYPVQARMEMLGQRFSAEVARLRSEAGGPKSDRTIGVALGVTAMTVHRMRRKHGIA